MFFGREEVLAKLDSLIGKRVASLVTCRGRRRIGKSTLIERFALNNEARFIKIEGIRPTRTTTNALELRSFAEQLALQKLFLQQRFPAGKGHTAGKIIFV